MIAVQSPGMAAQAGHGRLLHDFGQASQLFLLEGHGYQVREDVAQAGSGSAAGVAKESSDDALVALAHDEYQAGKYEEALGHCLLAHKRSPKRTDAIVLLGAIYYQLREYDACIEKNEAAIRLDPQLAEAYANLANALKEKGSIDLAIQYYVMAISLRATFCDAWSNLASAYMRKGLWQQAADCCRNALAINPRQVDAHTNLGNILKAQGLTQEAYLCYLEALCVDPTFAVAWSNLAGLFMESGDYPRAYLCYQEAMRLKPTFADAYLNQGNVLKAMGRAAEALVYYQNAIKLRPTFAMAYGNLGSVYYEQGHMDLAALHYRQALALDPTFTEAYNNLGNVLKDSGLSEEALTCYQSCLTLQPHHPQALTNLGNMYLEWNMLTEAAGFYRHAIAVTTGLSAPYSNLATIYKQQGQYAEAITCYNEALRIQPLAAATLVNRGNTLKELGRVSDAIQDYARAVTVRPAMAEAHANLASAYKDSGHPEAAIVSYQQALLLRADFPEASCNLLHTLQCVCDWDNRDAKFVELEGIIRRQIEMRVLPSVQPFHAIAYPIDPLLALEISERYAEHCTLLAVRAALPPFKHPAAIPVKAPNGTGRLRLGYVSSDFGNHPLSHLMGSVFGLHNRTHFEVFCYALSASDGSEWRIRISSDAEHFLDVSAMASEDIATRIAADGIQILVNLNGYTKGARNEIFAMKPAPIQISYMGFPGTTGAQYIDYLVTDEIVSPPKYAHIYSEKLVYLPNCYFVNDYKQRNKDVLEGNKLKRATYSLPEDKFLFACFNQLYKMDPEIFTTWCHILKRVPNSALWLLRFPAAGETRLRKFAAAQGVEPEQIIFTDVAAKTEHIKRSALADLFLDTPLCNAHTTGTDVLWAGLPMVTLPLEKMATRVAMSLCHAAGCSQEMVVADMKEYEELAVYYATNPRALQAVREKLEGARMTCPLFDTHTWVKDLERGFVKMWALNCEGRHPQPFKVVGDDNEFPAHG